MLKNILLIVLGMLIGYLAGLRFTMNVAANEALTSLKTLTEKAYRAGQVAEYGRCQETVIKMLNGMADGKE